MLPKVLAGFWAKRESFSSHFAWGLALELILGHYLRLETAFVGVVLVACLWELGGEVATTAISNAIDQVVADFRDEGSLVPRPVLWKSRALDIPPWLLGAGIGWFYLTIRS